MTDTVDELIKYGLAEGSELGEFVLSLCNVEHWIGGATAEFGDAYYKEVSRQLKYMKANFKIVTKEEHRTHYIPHLEDV